MTPARGHLHRSTGLKPRFARGFSMVELMIAIMILGLGLVMVATVFPVGLDMTRTTLQMSIAQAATEAAVATVQIKVPAYKNLDASVALPPNEVRDATNRVLQPDINLIELRTNRAPNTPPDTTIDANEWAAKSVIASVSGTPPGLNAWTNWPGALNASIIDMARVFTERTGWDAELSGDLTNPAFVLPPQNLPVDIPGGYASATDFTVFANLTVPSFGPRANMVRVSLVDSVYPPVDIHKPDGTPRSVPDVVTDVANRRYGWNVIAHRVSSNASVRDLLASVVVFYRGELGNRFARQEGKTSTPYDVNYNLPADRDDLLQPNPDPDPATDMQFPQPWLVVLGGDTTVNTNLGVEPSSGQVLCTAEVARLLPPNSYFIIARTSGNLVAGTAHKVLSSAWDPEMIGKSLATQANNPATLQIARDGGGLQQNVLAWVYPPPILNRRTATTPDTFATRSPVVGVALRGILAP